MFFISSAAPPRASVFIARVVMSAATAAVGWDAAPAEAAVVIVDQSARVDRGRGQVAFTLRLDAAPDFYTLDEFGRVADSFQYEIDGDGPTGDDPEFPVGDVEAVIRGDEIHVADALRVRSFGPDVEPDPDPIAGGWGPVVATVPFNLDGSVIDFEVPLDALGGAAADGVFSYRVFTTDFGLTTSKVEATVGVNVIPLPPGAWGALATGVGFAAVRLIRRRR